MLALLRSVGRRVFVAGGGVAALLVAPLLLARTSLAADVAPPGPSPAPPVVATVAPAIDPYEAYGFDPPELPNRTFLEAASGYGMEGFGFGVAGRVGTTFANGFYIGGNATYYGAQSLTVGGDTSPPTFQQVPASLFHTGLEGGYDLGRTRDRLWRR